MFVPDSRLSLRERRLYGSHRSRESSPSVAPSGFSEHLANSVAFGTIAHSFALAVAQRGADAGGEERGDDLPLRVHRRGRTAAALAGGLHLQVQRTAAAVGPG